MPALTSVVLTDRETAPINHTFTPDNVSGGVGRLVESTGVKIGDSVLTISSRRTPSGKFKVLLKLEDPIVDQATINGIPVDTVVRKSYGSAEFTFEATSTLQERKNTVGMLYSGLAPSQTMLNKVLTDLESVWG